MGWQDERRDFRSEVIHGDVVQQTQDAFHLAIRGEPDDMIWIPKSVLVDPDPHDLKNEDGQDLEVEKWWFDKNWERFD